MVRIGTVVRWRWWRSIFQHNREGNYRAVAMAGRGRAREKDIAAADKVG